MRSVIITHQIIYIPDYKQPSPLVSMCPRLQPCHHHGINKIQQEEKSLADHWACSPVGRWFFWFFWDAITMVTEISLTVCVARDEMDIFSTVLFRVIESLTSSREAVYSLRIFDKQK